MRAGATAGIAPGSRVITSYSIHYTKLYDLLELAFFLSGVAAVAFETLWFYQAGLGLGNSIWASSIVLAAFMGGLGIGNGWVGHYGDRLRDPLRIYAALEGAIAISGFALVLLLPEVTPALAPVFRPFLDAAWGLNGLRLALSFALRNNFV